MKHNVKMFPFLPLNSHGLDGSSLFSIYALLHNPNSYQVPKKIYTVKNLMTNIKMFINCWQLTKY